MGGKKIRLILAVIIYEMFAGPSQDGSIPREVLLVGGLIELLHSASLVIDDIEDSSLLRRGKPCSHTVFGIDRAINSANLIYFLSILKVL
jgi:geranylgeranyl pyrophosphate synthase